MRLICSLLLCSLVSSCSVIRLSSSKFSTRVLKKLPSSTSYPGQLSARPAYITVDSGDSKPLYLYHTISDSRDDNVADGLGRWVVNDVLGRSDTAMSFINSWAILPTLTTALADNAPNLYWMVHNGEHWVSDEEMGIECTSNDDSTIYFSVDGLPWRISGFFVEYEYFEGYPVYAHIGAEKEEQTYLYKLNEKWIIGNTIGSNNGLAYTVAPSVNNALLLVGSEWLFATDKDPVWQSFDVNIFIPDDNHDIYVKLRHSRKLNGGGDYISLRNGLLMPAIGLGTGGIPSQKTLEVVSQALNIGYRLFDSAREYGNERNIGEAIVSSVQLSRDDTFLLSKVWPTHLGFVPTSLEISKSLDAFQTPYIDMYLLHWPTCQHSIPWMHCETTVDPSGNWKQSWNALERAYAEGRLASIGVSNFDSTLLGEFWGFGTIRPHLVQNFAEPGKLDLLVRGWCSENSAVYMPYAHQRNLKFLSKGLLQPILNAAEKNNASSHVIASRFFYQTGAAVIPRSSRLSHLKENYEDLHRIVLTEAEMEALGWPKNNIARDEL